MDMREYGSAVKRRTRHRKVAGSIPDRRGGNMLFCGVNSPHWLLFRHLFRILISTTLHADSYLGICFGFLFRQLSMLILISASVSDSYFDNSPCWPLSRHLFRILISTTLHADSYLGICFGFLFRQLSMLILISASVSDSYFDNSPCRPLSRHLFRILIWRQLSMLILISASVSDSYFDNSPCWPLSRHLFRILISTTLHADPYLGICFGFLFRQLSMLILISASVSDSYFDNSPCWPLSRHLFRILISTTLHADPYLGICFGFLFRQLSMLTLISASVSDSHFDNSPCWPLSRHLFRILISTTLHADPYLGICFGFLFRQLSMLTLISASVSDSYFDNSPCWPLSRHLFHPRVTAIAHKRPRPLCQKCMWQLTAKQTCTLSLWAYTFILRVSSAMTRTWTRDLMNFVAPIYDRQGRVYGRQCDHDDESIPLTVSQSSGRSVKASLSVRLISGHWRSPLPQGFLSHRRRQNAGTGVWGLTAH